MGAHLLLHFEQRMTAMPVNIGQTIPVREQPYADIVPDIVTSEGRGIGLVNAATFDTEEPLIWPANFDQLPIEEQERIKPERDRIQVRHVIRPQPSLRRGLVAVR